MKIFVAFAEKVTWREVYTVCSSVRVKPLAGAKMKTDEKKPKQAYQP